MEIEGKSFLENISHIVTSPGDEYFLFSDGRWIGVYDNEMHRVNCSFEWIDENVEWIDIAP